MSLLGDANSKDMVKTAFASMLQKMTPSDLMVALHQEGAPLKLTIEGKPFPLRDEPATDEE